MTGGLVLSEPGETCEYRGWLSIDDQDECNARKIFFENYYPAYEFKGLVEDDKYPKGCFIWIDVFRFWGFFNTAGSGRGHNESRALCTIPEGK